MKNFWQKNKNSPQRRKEKQKNKIFRVILFLVLSNHRNCITNEKKVLNNLHPLRSLRLCGE